MLSWRRCPCDNDKSIFLPPERYRSGGLFYLSQAYHPVKGEWGMKTKMTGRAMTMAGGVAVGVAVCLFVTLAGASLVAALVLSDRLPEQSVGYCGYLIVPVSVMLGGVLSCCLVKRRRLLVSALVGGVYYGTLFCTASFFFGGVHHGAVLTAVVVMAAVLTVGLAGGRKRGSGRFDGRKYRPR